MLKLFEVEKALKGKPAEVRDQQEDHDARRPARLERAAFLQTDCVAGHIGFEL
jgi:hypothetical protein